MVEVDVSCFHLARRNGESTSSSSSTKETLWQKASSLRQSLRGRSRHESSTTSTPQCRLGRPASLYLADSSSRCSKSRQSLRREWGSQRDLSREKRNTSGHPDPPAAQENEKAWSSTWAIPDSAPPPPKQRSPRKLTKDSGYETSGAHGEPDYVNREWVTSAPSPTTSGAPTVSVSGIGLGPGSPSEPNPCPGPDKSP